MKFTNAMRRILSALLVFVLVFSMVPAPASAATTVDTAVIFSDLHTQKSDYKESTLKNVMTAVKNAGFTVSSVTSAGDAFSVNEDSSSSNGPYTGYTATLTNAIQGVLGNIPVNYVWSDHDRYAVQTDGSTLLDKTSRLIYGAGSDGVYGTSDDGNYYIYSLSMGDLCSYDRYNAGFNTDSSSTRTSKGFTATVDQAVANFKADTANLLKDRPLFITSHQPLFDNRNDNAFAEQWFDAINAVALTMDVAFFYGHNHKYDTGSDYYYAKGSTMPVATTTGWKGYQTGSGWKYNYDLGSVNKTLNFSHMCAGYLAPSSTGSTSSTTREGTLIVANITEDAITYTTYNSSGRYSGNYALDVTVPREFASTQPELVVSGTAAYFTGEALDLSVVYKAAGNTEDVTSKATLTGYNMNAAGDYTVQIAYGDLTAEFAIMVREKTFTDAATGITAEVSVPGATGMTVSTLGTDSQACLAVAALLSKAVAYDIDLVNGTEATISMPIPAGVADPVVYHVSDDGQTVTQMDLVQVGNTVTFEADRFSCYVIGQDDRAPDGNDVVVGDAGYSYVKTTTTPLKEGYYQLQNNHTSKYLTSTKTSGQNRLNLDSNGQNHIWYIKAVSGGYTVQYGGPNGQYLTFSHEKAAMSTSAQTIQFLNTNGYWGIGATSGNPVAYLAREGTNSSSTSVHGYASTSYMYPGDVGMDWNLYERIENQTTYTVEASNVQHYLGQNDNQVQLTYALLANGAAGNLPAGGSWTFETYKDIDGIVNNISNNGVITFNKVAGSCYVKIAYTWSEGTAYKYVKIIAERDPNACDHEYTAVTVEATCTEDGSITYTCDCGDSYVEVIAAIGHDYKSVVTAPTCTEGGYTTYTCACGDSYVADKVAALGHDYKSVTVAATCAKEGSVTYTCACGDTYTEVIPATGKHTYESVTVEATCTEAGSVTTTCSVCGDSSVEVLEALGHDYKCTETAATCGKDGSEVYTCVRCDDTYTEVIPATGNHKYESVTVDATCAEAGFITYTCECGDTYTDVIPATGNHTYTSKTVDATCAKEGSITYTCECGDTYTEVIPATGKHTYESVTVEATCTEAGSVTTTCSVCGDSSVETLEALGHDYECVETAATCGKDGSKVYTCVRGDDTYTEVIPATGNHKYESTVVDATCAEAGSITYTCECGDTYTEVIPATGDHVYESVTVEATCTEAGSVTYTCECGDTYTEVIPATGKHEYESVTVDATCAQAGSITYTCECGDTYTEVIPATDAHAYETVTVEPTCVAAGSATHTCAVCGDTYTEVIPATGNHIYQSETVNATCTQDGSTTYKCAFCSDSYVDTIPATGHNYTCTVTEATCAAPGSKVYTCSICGDTYSEEIPAIAHDYQAVVTAPTCTEGGFTTYTCTSCGDSYVSDATEALGHTYETATVEPTCTKDGSVTYYCACGSTYSETIPSTGHNYKTVVTAPNCVEAGYSTNTCVSCGDSYVFDQVDALGHSNNTVIVEPTCTVGGYTSDTCTVCGEGRIYDETAALGHDYISETVDPTETEGGYTTHTCDRCGHSYTDNYVDALGHSIVSVVTEPTCLTEGYTTHTCTTCGEVTVDTYVPALGHNYHTVTVDATCTADGSVTETCTTCGETSVEVIPAYGHDYEAAVTAPTCTEGGHTVYTCQRCGDSYVADQTEATGHNYTSITVDVTCTEDGYTSYLCTNCGDSYVGETVAALGHNYETVTANATCTEDGSITYVCSRCGDSYAEAIPATGHDYEAVITEATCTENGFTTYTCACGESYVSDETLATGHSYTCVEEDGNQVYTCDYCGDTYTVTIGWVALSGTYVLDTDGVDTGADNKYLVVGADANQALTLSGTTVGNASVQISGNTITLDDASKYEFYFQPNGSTLLLTQDGSRTVYHQNANMYYGNHSAGYWTVTNKGSGKYQVLNQDGNGNWSLNYGYVWGNDSASRFAVSYYERHVRLFKATDSYARLYGTLDQVWAHGADVTESAILSKVQIQTSANGVTADGTAALDSSMITWDKALDGYTAGTYTATVTYQGEELGTITVTVVGEHTYESATVEATCTEGGHTTHTCTVCGYSYTDGNTAALGHDYTGKEENGYMVYTCSRCGDSYSEKLTSTYTKVSSISGTNNYVLTLRSGNKYYALSHKNNTISAVQVTVSNNQITSEITEDLVWTYSNSKLSYTSGNTTYYLYAQPASGWWSWWSAPTLTISSSNSTSITFNGSTVKMGNYYLRYSSSKISLNSNSSTATFFIEE